MDPRQWRGDQGRQRGAGAEPRNDRPRADLQFALVLAATVASSAFAALVLAASANASPARFTYELCDSALPGGGVPVSSYSYSPDFTPFENCASPGGSIGVVETAPAAATFGALDVEVPETPGGFVESEAITALGAGIDPETPQHESHIYENGFPGSSGSAERIFHIRSQRDLFWNNGGSFPIVMSCDGNKGPCNPGPVVAAQYIAATEVDPTPPTLSGVEGTVLGGGVLRGHQTLTAKAHDVGGGLSEVSAVVNGTPAPQPKLLGCNTVQANNSSVQGTVAVTVSPCPSEAKGEWSLDTEVPPFHEGTNTVAVCAADFATLGEPNRSCSAPQSVDVDNSCTDSPVAGGELLSEQFAASNSETRTVEYGKGAEVVGRLANNAEDPVAGATLCVKLQTLGVQPQATTVGAVSTDANGDYSYRLPPGPNRDVVIGFRHDSLQVARDVRFYAHVRPTLEASARKLRNGERIDFSGQLPGPGRRGRVVILQANVLGSKRWITFRKATSARKGIFQASYHFTSTTRTTSYRFRAVVPDQAGYPWVQGHSKPVVVKVRP